MLVFPGLGANDFTTGPLRRFLDESRALANFRHPHIVRVSRFFEANGSAYMVMDYERGRPLNQWVRERGAFTLEEGVKMITLTPAMAWGFNDRGIIQTVNEASVRVFGWTVDELVGKNINIIMPEERARMHDSYLESEFSTPLLC